MLTIQEIIEKFHTELPLIIQVEFDTDEIYNTLKQLEKKYNIPLSPVVLRVAIAEIQQKEVAHYLEQEYNMPPQQASELEKTLQEQIFNPILSRLQFLNKDENKDMSLDQQKNFAENLFRTALVKELHHNPFIISAMNDRLFYILARDEQFKDRLSRALYENTEIVTSKSLVSDNEKVSPTVGHWLKDYITQYGSQTYDSLSQSKYLTSSQNTKDLSDEDRTLVHKVLKTYSNVTFFPESMPSDDGEGWEIIPGGLEAQSVEKVTIPTQRPEPQKTQSPKVLPKLKTITPRQKPVSPIQKSQTASSPDLLALKNLLVDYPQGSLERQAIEEEIKKLEQQ